MHHDKQSHTELYINQDTQNIFIRPLAAVHYDNSDVACLEASCLFLE